MREDRTAISQDDSGLLHAATIARYAYVQNESVDQIVFEDFQTWAFENDVEFIIGSKSDFRWLQTQIINSKLNADRATELSTLLEEHEGDDAKSMKALLYFLDDSEASS